MGVPNPTKSVVGGRGKGEVCPRQTLIWCKDLSQVSQIQDITLIFKMLGIVKSVSPVKLFHFASNSKVCPRPRELINLVWLRHISNYTHQPTRK